MQRTLLAVIMSIKIVGICAPWAHADELAGLSVTWLDSTAVALNQVDPQWSPDLPPTCDERGDYIVFREFYASVGGEDIYHLMLAKFATTGFDGPYPLLDTSGSPNVNHKNPQWSADGSQILFSKKDSGGKEQVYRVAVRESSTASYPTPVQITSGTANKRNAQWSPNSSVNLIAYEQEVTINSTTYWKVFKQCPNCFGGMGTQLTEDEYNDLSPQWNRTGEYVVFEREIDSERSDIYVVDVSDPGSEVLAVTKPTGDDKAEDLKPEWFDDDPAEQELDSVIVFQRRIWTEVNSVWTAGDFEIHEITFDPDLEDSFDSFPNTPAELASEEGVDLTNPQIDQVFGNKVIYLRVADSVTRSVRRVLRSSSDDIEIVSSLTRGPQFAPFANGVVFQKSRAIGMDEYWNVGIIVE